MTYVPGVSVTAYNTKIDEAVTAYEAGDVSGAIDKLDVALVLLAKVPDGADGGASMTWDRGHLLEVQKRWRLKLNASATTGGIRTSKITYANPGVV